MSAKGSTGGGINDRVLTLAGVLFGERLRSVCGVPGTHLFGGGRVVVGLAAEGGGGARPGEEEVAGGDMAAPTTAEPGREAARRSVRSSLGCCNVLLV